MAAGLVTQEVMWTRQLLDEMGFEQPTPTIISCDNLPAISMTKDDTHHPRTKHIDIKYHYIKHLTKIGQITTVHVPSYLQQADMQTKALDKPLYTRIRDAVMLNIPINLPTT